MDDGQGFISELRAPAAPGALAMAAIGLAILFWSDATTPPSLRLQWQAIGVASFAASLGALWLERWRASLGRWLLVVSQVALISLAAARLRLPGTLALMVVPVGLSAALLGTVAAAAVSGMATAAVLLTARLVSPPWSPADVAMALAVLWASTATAYLASHPLRRVAQWVWDHYTRAQRLLDEARNRAAELEQALDDLAHANRQLALANERIANLRLIAERAEAAKTAFVANVSHEFRTPLNMIIGLVSLMAETPHIYDVSLSEAIQEDLRVVHRNCQHLGNLVNDVLDLTRIEAGQLALRRERADLRYLIEEAIEVIRPLMDKKGLALHVTLDPALPSVYCDAVRIQQAILNLLSNAARFTEHGWIRVQAEMQDHQVVVSVADSGPGIPPEDLERIFEPFCQGGAQTWREPGGSGLGLSISEQLIRLHGGRMWVESTLGVGSRFSFSLPLDPPLEPVALPGHQIRPEWPWVERRSRPRRTGTPPRPPVLVCDEGGELASALARCSDALEFIPVHAPEELGPAVAEHGAACALINTQEPAQLWAALEAARVQAPHTPVLGCAVPRPARRAEQLGALGYLTKPVTRQILQRVLLSLGKPVERVLVVDDDADARRLFVRMLHACDARLEIDTAADGEEALERLRTRPPDLALVDVVMPGLDGYGLLGRLRADGASVAVPIFLVSAMDPADQPLGSAVFSATMDRGLSLRQLLRCLQAVTPILGQPEAAAVRASG